VHHAIQIPLRVDLLASTVVKAGQAFVVPDIGKHRLDRTNALAAKNWNLTPIYFRCLTFEVTGRQSAQLVGDPVYQEVRFHCDSDCKRLLDGGSEDSVVAIDITQLGVKLFGKLVITAGLLRCGKGI
jgi:hypothetical protein